MYFGVDYYPEHWNIDLIEEDLNRMRQMGVNIIRIGEFAWHLMEKEEGKYDFSFFDDVIEKAKNKDFKIIFGTPTATFPSWLSKKHPEILSEFENGQKKIFGGRRQYCFNSDIYIEYSKKIVKNLVSHYSSEEAIVVWQVDNEFGHEDSDHCYCEKCHKKFQKFLNDKYESIEKLNESYGTIFWGQTYNDFEEIPIPKKTITTHNPSLKLDWARFRSHSLNNFARIQYEEVTKNKGKIQKITHNLPGGFFDKIFDQNELTKDLDFVSYDNYPVWGGLEKPIEYRHLSMTLDYIRGLKNMNFWIVEQLMGAQGHDIIGYLPRHNQAKMWAFHAFSHGCENMLWFRWRGMTRGQEQFCLGIIDQNNKISRKYNEVKDLIEDVKKNKELFETEIKSDIAILYDFDNNWSWKGQKQSKNFDFTNELLRLYSPFKRFNVNIDVISMEKEFGNYKILLVPVMQIVDDEFKDKIDKFLENGGTVVFSYRLGIKDRNNNIFFGEIFPSKFNDICGIEIEESESLGEKGKVKIFDGNNEYEVEIWRDLVKTTTAKSLYSYKCEFSNYSCVTENKYKNGISYYIGGGVEEKLILNLAKTILKNKKIKFYETDYNVQIVEREYKDNKYLIIINHSGDIKKYKDIELNPYEYRILSNI